MCARRSTSSTAPRSSTPAKCCSRAPRTRSWPIRTCVASIWASGSNFPRARRSRAVAGVSQPSLTVRARGYARTGPGGAKVALSARLELRQGQSLVITPQLQQAIKLQQLSNLELEAYVEGELERNPLLQRDERDNEPEAEPERVEVETYDTDHVSDAAAAADLDARPDDVY